MELKEYLKNNQDLLLIILTVILLAILAGIFIWGMVSVAFDINKAIQVPTLENSEVNFDLNGAQKLNLRGLAQ